MAGRLGRARTRAESRKRAAEKPPASVFTNFGPELSRLETQAKRADGPEAIGAASRLIGLTKTLCAEVQRNAPQQTQDNYDDARLALERVVKNARDAGVRKMAFGAMDWDRISLNSILKSEFPDVRQWARKGLSTSSLANSHYHRQTEIGGTGKINEMGAWHT
jgi:hypothetical protein